MDSRPRARSPRERLTFPVHPADFEAALQAAIADQSALGARDAAVLTLLGQTGLRDGEILRLRVEDVDLQLATVHVGQAIRPLSDLATAILTRWRSLRGNSPGPLLHPVTTGGAIVPKPISRGSVNDALRRRCKAAGVRRFTPSQLQALAPANPVSVAVLQFLLRHGYAMRVELLKRLNRLASHLSDGRHDAMTLDWDKVSPDRLAGLGYELRAAGQRQINAMKTALHGILAEGVKSGLIEAAIYNEVIRQRWTVTQ